MADPAISVVVPMYEVAPYVEDCLRSIAAQTCTDLEVICIDDGSTDGSGDIAAEFAAGDARFRVVRQDNSGLSAARNAGAALATGEFLAFVDSDDLLHPDAYAPMIRSLRASGSDFATGSVQRLTSLGLRSSPTFAPVFATPMTATHVTRHHVLLVDRLVPTKVWRRSFWEEHGFAFPVGVVYEDIPVTIPAHFLARSVDVLDSPMYQWRIRGGADRSITQRRFEPRNMRDRVAVVTGVSRFLAEGGWDAEKREYDRLCLTGDLRYFAVLLDLADPTFVEDFVARAGEFLAQAHPEALTGAPVVERLRWHLIGEGAVTAVAQLAQFVRLEGDDRPALQRFGKVRADIPVDGVKVPRALLELDDELSLDTRITAIDLRDETVTIEGHAHIRHLEAAKPRDQRLTGRLIQDGTDEVVPLTIERVTTDDATARARPDVHDLTYAGFRATVTTSELTSRWEKGVDRWQVELTVTAGRTARTGPLQRPDPGTSRRPPFLDAGKLRVTAKTDGNGVELTVAARPVTLVACRPVDGVAGGGLVLCVRSRRDLTSLALRRAHVDDRTTDLHPVGSDRFEATVPANWFTSDPSAGSPGRNEVWAVHAVDTRGKAARVVIEGDGDQVVVPAGPDELSLDITRYGNVSVGVRPPALWLDRVELADGDRGQVLRVGGRWLGGDPLDEGEGRWLELTPRDHLDVRLLPLTATGQHRYEAELPIAGLPDPATADPSPLPSGTWQLAARVADATGAPGPSVPVEVMRSLIGRLPVGAHDPQGRRVDLDDLSWQRPALVVGDGLAPDERGRHHTAARWAEASRRRTVDPTTALFVGAAGHVADGDVAAVLAAVRARRPDLTILGAVDDPRAAWPEATAVRVGSRAWHQALATAGLIVTDGPLPAGFSPVDGQRVVRLWSGPPVRSVGLEVTTIANGHPRYRDAVREQAARWGLVVTPSPAVTEVLRRTHGDTGPAIERGAPRFDVLARPDEARARRVAVRDRLGIPAGGRVVAYLPTRAEDERHPGGAFRSTPELDVARVRAAVGDDAWVLVRSHPDVLDRVGDDVMRSERGRVIDVSRHVAEVDLLLAADLVVVPPTSVALDAALTATPVVVFDPNRSWASGQQGALAIDLLDDVPWTVATDDDEVAAAVADTLAAPPEAQVLRAFAAEHGDVASGGAADAVAAAILP